MVDRLRGGAEGHSDPRGSGEEAKNAAVQEGEGGGGTAEAGGSIRD